MRRFTILILPTQRRGRMGESLGFSSLGSFGLGRVSGVRVAGVVFWTCTARQPCRSGNAPLAVRGW
jgi:hypothetical protein